MTDEQERFTPKQRTYGAMAAIALVSLAAGYGLSTLGGESEVMSGDVAGGECEDVLY